MTGIQKKLLYFFAVFMAGLLALPLYLLIVGSLSNTEALYNYYGTFSQKPMFLPQGINLEHFDNLLIFSVGYLDKFWNSVFLSFTIAIGQSFVALICGYMFAKVKFKLKRFLFTLYVLLMMMPYQVIILPMYIVSKWVNIYDSHLALILPGFFAPFSVFMMHQFMRAMPDEVIEATKLETNSALMLLSRVVAPVMQTGLIVCFVIAFAESWGMIEQPLVLIQDQRLWPLSLMLAKSANKNLGLLFAGSIIYAIPAFLLYLTSKRRLMAGVGDI